MRELTSFKSIILPEMLELISEGSDITMDSIRVNKMLYVCLLTISFLLFLLIISVVYIKPDIYVSYCDFKQNTSDFPQLLYSEPNLNLAVQKYVGIVNDYVADSINSFLPDVSDIEVIDETNNTGDPQFQTQTSSEGCNTQDREALTAVKMAVKFKQMNNLDKAQKLFQHAIALSPNHHDVLLHYGEFLESGKDFINADHFYLKALILRPENSRVLANRRRVLPVVNQIDQKELNRIDSKRAALVSLNKRDASLKRLKKEIYFQHIYHTVAIEGNKMSLAETRTVFETRMAVPGKSILEHNEILGLESALRYINQTLANKNGYITVSDILEIHRRVMGHVDPLTAGTFRKSQVYVGEHAPPEASDVEILMEEFVELLRAPDVTNMHPIHVAAFAHHKLVFIHPFIDGNGRTGRLLMNLLFIRYGYPPIIIRKEERSQYYKCLRIANEGDSRPFYRFIARATEYTIDSFLHAHKLHSSNLKALESNIKDVIPVGR